MKTPIIDTVPLWAICAGTFALMFAFAEIGRLLCGRRTPQTKGRSEASASGPTEGPPDQMGTIVASTLALFALVLGFTFSAAAARYEGRRTLLIKDTNAIGTTYLRARLLPAPYDEAIERRLREYVALRVNPASDFDAAVARSEQLQRELWAEGVASSKVARDAITGLFLEALNEMIDVHTERLTMVIEHRVPAVVWATLYLLATVSMVLTGYEAGLSMFRKRTGVIILTAAFSLVVVLIVLLDRPIGGLPVSQKAMADLLRSFDL